MHKSLASHLLSLDFYSSASNSVYTWVFGLPMSNIFICYDALTLFFNFSLVVDLELHQLQKQVQNLSYFQSQCPAKPRIASMLTILRPLVLGQRYNRSRKRKYGIKISNIFKMFIQLRAKLNKNKDCR